MGDGTDDWLGLRDTGDGRHRFDLAAHLARSDGGLYGGTAVAAGVACMEATTSSPASWLTVQFVAQATVGDALDVVTEVFAAGRRTHQLRLTATVGGRVVFAALGATSAAREGGLDATFPVAPPAPLPDPSGAVGGAADRPGWLAAATLVPVTPPGEPLPEGRMLLWVRWRERALSRASLGFFADVVSGTFLAAAGRAGTGTSLDNTIRFGAPLSGEWVLLEVLPEVAVGGIACGTVRLWSEDGALVAVASQTTSLRVAG